ncbi:MAG: hypothetical protein IKZ82_12650 [Clostridia bacterium]|nr:hypothetical protein [Clostridia bacterium]
MIKKKYTSFDDSIDNATEAPYPMDYRTISSSRFEGTWPRPFCSSVNENLMDDNDDSFYEIAKNYLEEFSV